MIITYLGIYPEVEYPPSSLCVYVFQPQLAKDENLHRKDLQAKPASDQRHTGNAWPPVLDLKSAVKPSGKEEIKIKKG